VERRRACGIDRVYRDHHGVRHMVPRQGVETWCNTEARHKMYGKACVVTCLLCMRMHEEYGQQSWWLRGSVSRRWRGWPR
jgi:hypothetical protein